MQNDFYIGGVGSGEFGVRLLSDYTVGGTPLTRSRQKLPGVQGWLPLATEYGLRSIKLPVHLAAKSPRAAAEQKSRLDAAFAAEPVELYLPNGFYYTASLESAGEAQELSDDGCLLECTYTLLGYAHDPLETVTIPAGGGTLYARGTAPEMACRLTCTVGAAAAIYTMAGVTWWNVAAGDVLVLDDLERRVLRGGGNDFANTNLITWPKLTPGENTLTAPDAVTVEYYPIWL
ncbi:MAG: hypothetical protein IJ347_09510 [Faecalibacterium sp.]|nr:hypothetical protein [Faecalibacterium sp.]